MILREPLAISRPLEAQHKREKGYQLRWTGKRRSLRRGTLRRLSDMLPPAARDHASKPCNNETITGPLLAFLCRLLAVLFRCTVCYTWTAMSLCSYGSGIVAPFASIGKHYSETTALQFIQDLCGPDKFICLSAISSCWCTSFLTIQQPR